MLLVRWVQWSELRANYRQKCVMCATLVDVTILLTTLPARKVSPLVH
ncbi:hypothetical protein WRSd3_03289 [Shigella dysenteriae WRSd3]|uniref:Uncharacterized protein n=1 Tax=Shigella dysenteriae WRSd3 TaxID=1401327 RepID=A0A090NE07_SHIDY|nr:hypothetical protein [Escherichia coli]ESU77914.1 hypothetical protein WRSd3_03289 [Shigella dysenteriae WRSd3]